MIRKSVTYTNFSDERVTEDLYFHLSTKQWIDFGFGEPEDLQIRLKELSEKQDIKSLYEFFEKLIGEAYGTREQGGNKFSWADEKETKDFLMSPAFDALLGDLVADEKTVQAFIMDLMPPDLVKKEEVTRAIKTIENPQLEFHGYKSGDETPLPSEEELLNMTPEELREALRKRAPQ